MTKTEKRAMLIKKMQAEIDRRTELEEEAIELMSNGEFEKATDLLKSIDDGIVKEIEKELNALEEETVPEENKLENICVFHWLDCLYQDFLNKRVAGEQFPCNSCPKVSTCEECPPSNFDLAGGKFGLKVRYYKDKSQQ